MKEYAVNDIVTGFKWVGTRPIRPDGVPKVTGRAMYAADYTMAGAIIGKILRSPHAHARIRSINTSKAEKLPGVKAVITAKDFPEQKFEYIGPERVAVNFWHVTRNIMAREKTLYEGHAVAAVAAIDAATADEALSLIEVDYEVLPHVIDVDEAMNEDAPLLFEDMITRGVEPTPTKPSNISKRLEFKIGDLDAGWARADVIVEEEFKTAAVHQGYIEPHACCVRVDPDGQTEVWSSSQGHFVVRALTAKLLNKPVGDVRCSPAEIGGGFGGKTVVYLEPVAALLSQKTGRPIKMTMTRDEVFKATGPTSGGSMWVKMGVTKDGKITAADGIFKFQAGAFPGSPVMNACLCAFAPYAIENARSVGYDVVCNRPKSAAYRAPGSPISAFAVESVLDMLAKKIGMDPLELRRKNAAGIGTTMIYGPKLAHGGYVETLEALINHPAWKAPLGKNQGRGVASGYWFNGGGESSASVQINAGGVAPGFASQFCDVEVDPETGKVTVLRFVAAQDVGRAIHPSYVEGQIQGGVTQGIGWALNEEYIYDAKGRLDNAGFLDYRCPVASDLPMIEAVLVEVPNPAHPFGAKGVGEVNIVPPMAAIANAIDSAIDRRLTELPMSPPKVRAALDDGAAG